MEQLYSLTENMAASSSRRTFCSFKKDGIFSGVATRQYFCACKSISYSILKDGALFDVDLRSLKFLITFIVLISSNSEMILDKYFPRIFIRIRDFLP